MKTIKIIILAVILNLVFIAAAKGIGGGNTLYFLFGWIAGQIYIGIAHRIRA